MSKPLQAIIFDLDGVITDTAEYHYLAWVALAKELEIPFSKEMNEKLKGISRMESLEKILEFGGKSQAYTEDEKIELATRKNNHYLSLVKEITPNDILPGIKQLIKDIKSAGLPIGLASASKNASTVIEKLELMNSFDVIVDAARIRQGKPNPEIFLKAAKRLQVDPKYCLGIEDAAAGVDAIKSAGMFAVAIGDKDTLGHADIIYETTAELSYREIVEKWNSRES